VESSASAHELQVFASPRVSLAPRVKIAWILSALAAFFAIYIITFLPLGLLLATVDITIGVTALLLPAVVAMAAVPLWAQMAYDNYWYALLREDLVVARGILFKTRTYVPYGRIQNVNVTRTVIDRLLGLSRLTVDTAGASFAEGVIPGVLDAEPLVGEIMGRAEEARLARARWSTPHDADALAYEQIRRSLRELIVQAHALEAARAQTGES
jgi:membrane protein YdbS with pleckstrin-like domain